MKALTFDQIGQAITDKGYKFFNSGGVPYDINLYGIRNKSPLVDEWNDVLGVAYIDEFGNAINLMHRGTTKPGLYYLKTGKMGSAQGTAILVPGQYRSVWKIGHHLINKPTKKYDALQQTKANIFKVWRDADQDGELDYSGKIWDNVTGLNMHAESFITEVAKVGAYSAGCQVRADDFEHFAVMNIVKKAARRWGDTFSYTLLDEIDVY